MVNFNFGLGGLVGDDDAKKDDAAGSIAGNGSTTQDDGIITDNQVINPEDGSTEITEEEIVTANEPVFENDSNSNSIEEPSTENQSAKIEDPRITADENIAETLEKKDEVTANESVFENDSNNQGEFPSQGNSALTTMDNEESWLNNEEEPKTIESSEASPTEPILENSSEISKENLNNEEVISAEEAIEGSTISSEIANPFPEASKPIIEEISAPVPEVNNEEASSQEESLFTEKNTNTVQSHDLTDKSSNISQSIEIEGAQSQEESNINKQDDLGEVLSEKIEEPIFASSQEKSVVENTENKKISPEIPTFNKPESNLDESFLETSPEINSEKSTKESSLESFNLNTKSDRALGGEELFDNSTESNTEDLLAPAAIGIIGKGASNNDNPKEIQDNNFDNKFNLSDKKSNTTSPDMGSIIGDNSGDDGDDGDDATNDPVDTLKELKNGFTKFVESHNSKINDYKAQIAELNKKIKEEKDILKDKQSKSAKILDDLNILVANFSSTNSVKKKQKKKINKAKQA